ncbi:MAG: riboflavin biosynthesis protein RibF [Candidatus Omnitrophota bacterium]
MKVFYSLNNFLRSSASSGKFAVTIGVFDGLHRGHQRIAKTLIKKARRRHLSTLLITFDPHPANVLKPAKGVPLLISLKHRLRLLGEIGIDYVIVMRFTRRLLRMDAADFTKKILSRINAEEIVVGKGFVFGSKRRGSLRTLRKFSGVYGYRINAVCELRHSGGVISSTRIRNLILNGELLNASRLLLRPVVILGTVVKGHKRGRIIGYPTANIDPHHEAIPPSGVYVVKIKLEKKLYKGILNIGTRPTFARGPYGDREPTIEVHMFNFNKTIYGKDLEINFVRKIRNERKFIDPARLIEQIKKDEKRAKQIFRPKEVPHTTKKVQGRAGRSRE